MRICIVHDYSLKNIGGATTSLIEQKRALENSGHDIFILQLGDKSTNYTFGDGGIKYIKPLLSLPESLYSVPVISGSRKNRRMIHKILLENKVEIIHLQSEMTLAYLVQSVAKDMGIPVVFTIHSFFWRFPDSSTNGLVTFALKSLFSLANKQKLVTEPLEGNSVEQTLKNISLYLAKKSDALVSPSQHQANAIAKTSLQTPCYVVPNPFGSKGSSTPKLLKNVKTPVKILWIGRCDPEKRPLEFIEAVKIAKNSTEKPFEVDFVGTGKLLDAMKKQAKNLPDVKFHGKLAHAKAVQQIDKSHIVALVSYHFDNQPMVIAEATSRYRPVLLCDERLTEGTSGASILTKNETPQAIAEVIVQIVENPNLLTELSKGAQKSSQMFSHKAFTESMNKIYKSLLKS